MDSVIQVVQVENKRRGRPRKENKTVDQMKEYKRQYYEKNKNNKIKHHSDRMKNDFLYRFKHNTRSLIRGSFKRSIKGMYKKAKQTEQILGCSMQEFILYIESKLKDGMSLGNHGEWHLDHIIPLATAKTEEEIIKRIKQQLTSISIKSKAILNMMGIY